MIDPDTPLYYHQKTRRKDGKTLNLVASDEFELKGRSFAKGKDKFFEAIEKPDDTNDSIQFYNSSKEYVTTKDGNLVITTRAVKTHWVEWDDNLLTPNHFTKNYTSGMVQTWNKFCFTGGIIELSIDLPGDSDSGGLWPAVWLMGNLARAGFQKSTLYMWPWSYDTCGSIPDLDTKQEINACDGKPGFGLNPYQGRGAPEIDIFEVMPGHSMPGHKRPIKPFMSSSLQISPGISLPNKRPINGNRLNSSFLWYDDLYLSKNSDYNFGFWGQECGPEKDFTPNKIHKYMEDAISANTNLNQSHFDSHHKYILEWQPGKNGYLNWYLDSELLFAIEGESLQKVTGSLIPNEPMYLIMNTAISHRWGMPEPCPIESCPVCWRCYDCTNPECQCSLPDGMKNCKNLPAEMKIDYIRLYQDLNDSTHHFGCSSPEYPTKEFIESHQERYQDWKPYSSRSPMAVFTILTYLFGFLFCAFCSYWIVNKVLYYFKRRHYRQLESDSSIEIK